jgi:hypothetical protein
MHANNGYAIIPFNDLSATSQTMVVIVVVVFILVLLRVLFMFFKGSRCDCCGLSEVGDIGHNEAINLMKCAQEETRRIRDSLPFECRDTEGRHAHISDYEGIIKLLKKSHTKLKLLNVMSARPDYFYDAFMYGPDARAVGYFSYATSEWWHWSTDQVCIFKIKVPSIIITSPGVKAIEGPEDFKYVRVHVQAKPIVSDAFNNVILRNFVMTYSRPWSWDEVHCCDMEEIPLYEVNAIQERDQKRVFIPISTYGIADVHMMRAPKWWFVASAFKTDREMFGLYNIFWNNGQALLARVLKISCSSTFSAAVSATETTSLL